MAIGDDLQILLGMVPIRDRAGIARGTMADAASAAAAKPDGQAPAPMNGARPPAFALPPGMLTGSSPPPADVQLPDDVNTEYTAGSGGSRMSPVRIDPKVPLPQSSERVIDSSPAAAPSPSVVRHSDILMQAYLQKQRAERLQSVFQSLGNFVSAAQGQSTHGGVSGGSGGPDMGALKTILDQRTAEDQATELLAQKKRQIDDAMLTQNLTKDRATALVESGEYKTRNTHEALMATEKVRERSRILQDLEPHLPAYAAALGMEENALRLLARTDPDKAIELMKPKAMEDARKAKLDNINTESAQTARAAEVRRLIAAGASPEDIIAAVDPSAATKGFEKRRELAEEGGHGTAVAQRTDFEKNHQAKAVAARDYLEGPGRQLGDMWREGLVTGTFSDLRRSALWRPLATLTGLSDKDLNDTAKVESALKAYVIANAKQLGTNPTDRDAKIIAAAGGNTSLQANELREIIGLNERAERQKIIAAQQRHAELSASGPKTAREMREIQPIQMPEPSKILKDDVMLPANAPVRQQLIDMKKQLDAHPDDPKAQAAYTFVATNFDRNFGAHMSKQFLDTGGKGWPTR